MKAKKGRKKLKGRFTTGKWLKRYSEKKTTKKEKQTDYAEIYCPVCGYYCLGKGGFGCIHKPDITSAWSKREKAAAKK